MYCHNKFGFTLIEILLVLALMTVILGLSAVVVFRAQFVTIHEARSQMISLLAFARSEAMQGYDGRMIGVKIEAESIMLVASLPTATSSSEQALQTDTETLAHVATNPNKIEVWFYPASGRASSPGEIELTDVRTLATTSISILYEGVIE